MFSPFRQPSTTFSFRGWGPQETAGLTVHILGFDETKQFKNLT